MKRNLLTIVDTELLLFQFTFYIIIKRILLMRIALLKMVLILNTPTRRLRRLSSLLMLEKMMRMKIYLVMKIHLVKIHLVMMARHKTLAKMRMWKKLLKILKKWKFHLHVLEFYKVEIEKANCVVVRLRMENTVECIQNRK